MNREDVKTFDSQLIELADLAKALAHPGRLRILQILAQTRGCVCGDIVQRLPFSLDSATILRAQSAFTQLFTGMGCCPQADNEGELHEL